ncbi:hypothetical protein [Streptomyces sp. H27-D2]|uniref:hypothetical protein n=1 Tax=Streptomyces sp. H27-D2 TaxID=3046304 RepID=UPI002DB70AE6|nr:hypothetical protein [Streptomyces sp. H27-D2]MEC4014813.1 hypothetical protein [Streptomyces sp. H27-D2]
MEAVIGILVLLFLVVVIAGGYAGVKLLGKAARGVDRTVAQARRSVEDTTLRAKSAAFQAGVPSGAAGELAQLRLSLRTSMRATQQALGAAAPDDSSLAEAMSLFERLSAHGHELDEELKRLEHEPVKVRIAERLGELRERTERITHSADSLRWAAQDRARQFADDDLAHLNAQIDVETGALRHWVTEEPLPDGRQAAAADADGGGSAAGDGAGADASGAAKAAGTGIPPAIAARNPYQRTSYPWQKTARPKGAG